MLVAGAVILVGALRQRHVANLELDPAALAAAA
jgi:hypothetical protein